jgi:hypothetical protein
MFVCPKNGARKGRKGNMGMGVIQKTALVHENHGNAQPPGVPRGRVAHFVLEDPFDPRR